MTKFQCCKTSLPHIGAHIHTLFWKQCNVSRWLKLVVWVTDLNCIFTTMVEVACMDHLQLHPNNFVFAIVPKRGHAPQFCDEILNFQCCMAGFLAWSQKIDCMDHRLELRLYSLGSRLYYSWLAILILGAIFVILITWFLQLYLESNIDICPQVAYCHTNFNMDK